MAFLIRVYYHFLFLLVTDNMKQQKLLNVTDATRMTKSITMYHSVLPCLAKPHCPTQLFVVVMANGGVG